MSIKGNLLELLNQINITLKSYEDSRKPMSTSARNWSYFFMTITVFLTVPFFRAAFRDDKLTEQKVIKVKAMRDEFSNRIEMIKNEKKPDAEAYISNIVDDLDNLLATNSTLEHGHNKYHLSKQQVAIFGSKKKPTLFQSGFTLAIESCFELIAAFNKSCEAEACSTAQVSAQLGHSQQPPSNSYYPSPPPYYQRPPASNPNASAPAPEDQWNYQPGAPQLRS